MKLSRRASIPISISITLFLLTIACTNLQPPPEPTTPPVPTEEPLEPAATVAIEQPTAEPTATPSPTPEPDIPLPETVSEAKTEGISLFYDEELIPSYTVENIAATAGQYGFGVDGPTYFYYDVPDFIRFELHTDSLASRPTYLVIQPIRTAEGEFFASYQGEYDPDYQRVTALEAWLDTPPENQQRWGNYLAHVQPLDFSNGRGLRYIGLIPFALGLTTVTNDELYYIYEGVSDDGRYYIWLQYPIATNTLPNYDELDIAEVEAINAGDLETWLAEQMTQLDARPSSEFDPDLRRLDLMMETLFVAPDASTVTSIPRNDPDCINDAQFVADVTIPDGTPIRPRTEFTKTWRIRNTGTCTWSAAYFLAPPAPTAAVTPLRVDHHIIPVVPPGEQTELSITFLAPPIPGYFRSEWQLQPPFGVELSPAQEGFGPIVYTEITVNSAAEVATPSGAWQITNYINTNPNDDFPEDLLGQTVTFTADTITFNGQTCTDIAYSGRFAYGSELTDFNDLVPEDITSGIRGYLELIRTTCDLPYFDQFIRQGLPFDNELLIRYDEGVYMILRPQE